MRQKLPFISGSISQMLVAQSLIGQATTTAGIALAAEQERGRVADGDLIVAACRRFAVVNDAPGLIELCNRLDVLLDS